MRDVIVAGVGMAKFGRHPDKEYQELGFKAVIHALNDADMQWKDIESIFCANAYSGMAVGHNIAAKIGKTGVPIVNIENACSGGASAFRLCYQSVATGMYDACLAIGVEKIPGGLLNDTSWPEHERKMGFNVQPANYALELQRHMKSYGTTLTQVARVSVKNRKNGVLNPYAGFQKKVSLEEVLNSRVISTPLRLLMCCANGDGAAAAILCSPGKIREKNKRVNVAASVLVSETYGNKKGAGSIKYSNPDRTEIAAKQAYEASGYGPEDMDLVEVYDTMASAEIINAEKLGICNKGEYGPLLEQDMFDLEGKLPINTSGGLLSRRHPLSASGLAQIAEVVWQLRGEAGPRQVPKARLGMCHCLGAGGNCMITILKK
jgi:acetyl-CoA acetyltransferase